MSKRLSLEEFGQASAPAAAAELPAVDMDAFRLEAYEEGYQSGWDDCRKAQEDTEAAVLSDLAQNLRDLSFTYHEARGDVLGAIRPVLHSMVEKLLPHMAERGFATVVATEVMPHLEAAAELDCELIAAPQTVPLLERMIEGRDDISVRLHPEPAYSPAQLSLRMGAETREIDLGRVITEIGTELDNFVERLLREPALPDRKGAVA